MWKKLIQLVSGKDIELRDRMLRTIILVGGLAAIVANVEMMIVTKAKNDIVYMMLLLLVVMGISLVMVFKYRKNDLAAMFLGIMVAGILFPVMFLMGGGIESGTSIMLALGVLYVFIMFTGKKLWIFLTLTFISYGITYLMAYRTPELVKPMPTESSVYIDSFISIFIVGIIAGSIIKAHMKVFEAEHELNLRQKEELERSNASRNIFFANMSHEIRTPINAIIGLNEMIIRSNPAEEIQEYAKDIQVASKMLLNQVNDILELSQLEMEKMKIVTEKYATKDLFRDLIELVRVQLEKKNLELYLDIDKNIPSILLGDEKRLKQVLLNILDNAVKYTPEGSVTFSVVGDVTEDGFITLQMKVADTGIGIKKEDLASIYDAFNRFDEKKNKRILGSGLGLAITKQLVDLLGGEITVDSIYTKGTVFTISLKQQIVDSEPIGDVNYLGRRLEKNDEYKPLFEAPEARILIVDDSKMNRMVASRLLASTKVQIDVASGGVECLEMTTKKYYNVILLDYMMPDMSGTEVLKALRVQENSLCRDSAVIVLTGNVLIGARQQYISEGFDGYVEKPIQGRLMEEEILKFLPLDIIEYQENYEEEIADTPEAAYYNQMRKLSKRRRKKVYITADCTCDIPTELLEKYDIKVMYLYIKTPNGRFADTREIDSDSIEQYISAESSVAYGDRVSVEEYEEFFAEVLTQAEEVIHISLASKCGKSCDVARMAATGFDHVHIVDSGQISCGQGLITLYAAKLALEGKSAGEICDSLEKMIGNVHTRVIMPGADIFYKNGRTSAFVAGLCRTLQLHPFVGLVQKNAILLGLMSGTIESAWKQGIWWMFRKKKAINKDVVFITYVGCSVKEQEWIKREILKYVPFENVIIQKTSFTTACNVGMKSIGISYYLNKK